MSDKDHDSSHSHENSKVGISDMLIGVIVFLLISEGVFHLIGSVQPSLISREALFEIRLSGGLFFIVWASLGNGVFAPFLESAFAREAATIGASQTANELRSECAELELKLEESLRESRLKGIRSRDSRVDIAKKEAAEFLEAAKRANGVELAAAQEDLQKLRVKAEADLEQSAGELKQLVVDQVLAESRAIH